MNYTNRCSLLLIIFIMNFSVSKPPHVSGNRTPSKPFITGDGFRAMANHVYDETDDSLKPDEIHDGDIIFIKGDKAPAFFVAIHPYINCHYILITHNSDEDSPGTLEKYLEDEKIIKWFGQNPTIIRHPKFVPIPIGVANRYITSHGNCDNFKHFWLQQRDQKIYLLGYNFDGGRAERGTIINRFTQHKYVHNLNAWPHMLYLNKMSQAKYILSPRGNGLDCHRTWEAFIVGAAPVLKSSMLDELLEGLPVLIVNNWEDVSKKLLKQTYRSLKDQFNEDTLKKVTYAYWHDELVKCQAEALEAY